MFRFAHIEYLYGLFAILLFVVVFVLHMAWRKKKIALISSPALRSFVLPQLSRSSKWMHFTLFVIAWILLVFGIANPQMGSKLFETKHEGIDLVLAIDVSNSMLAEDIRPNRLERTRLGIQKLIDNLQGDRLGIVIFAGQAFVQLPITTDYAAAKLFSNSMNTNSINEQGTSIGAAIELSLESFDFETPTSKVIIVVTDGEDHEENAIKMAELATEKGVKVFTIGMGSSNGSPIPLYRNGVQLGYLKDAQGNTVVTKLNEDLLVDIANAGNGKYFRATNGAIGLNAILDEINKLEKTELESKIYSDYEDQFIYFLIAALLMLVIEILWPEKRLAILDKIQLFGVKK
jgi:Ca-activated chloride channel family protein